MAARMEEGTPSTPSSTPVEKTQLLPTSPSANLAPPKLIMSLHMPRLLGAMHVVMFHFFPYGWYSYAGSGNMWVTFFFMLSAFGTAHSQVRASGLKKVAESGPWFLPPSKLLRRWMSVYPTYLFAFLLSCFTRCYSKQGGDTCFHPSQLVIEGTMLTGWFPWTNSGSTINSHWYNLPGWYIGALTGLWLFEVAVVRIAALACVQAGRGNVPYFAIVCNVAWLLCSPLAGFPYTWQTPEAITSIPIFNALQTYFCGALVACWLHSRASAGLPPFRFAATISSVLLLGCVFTDVTWFGQDPHVVAANEKIRRNLIGGCNVQVPLFGFLIAGLAGGADPLAIALNWLPVWLNNAARDLATGIYLLQSPMADIIVQIWQGGQYRVPAGAWLNITKITTLPQFFALLGSLFVVAFLVHHGVQQTLSALVLSQFTKRSPKPPADSSPPSSSPAESSASSPWNSPTGSRVDLAVAQPPRI